MRTESTSPAVFLIHLLGAGVVFLGWWPVPGSFFLLEPVLFCVIALVCLLLLQVTTVRITRRSMFAYGAFAVWVVFADALSGEFLPALARDVHWLILPLLVVLYKPFFARNEDALKALQVAVAFSLIVIAYRLIDGADAVFDWVKLPIFGNIRRLAMTAGLMSVFLYLDAGYRQSEKWLLVLARVVGLSLLFWSGSRGAMLAWLLALLMFIRLTQQGSRWRGWSLEIGVAIALSILFDVGNPSMGFWGAFLRSWISAVTTGTFDSVSSGRMSLWIQTLAALHDPRIALLGAGGNGFVRLHLMFGQIFHPHNILLQAVSDWGLVGLLLLLWLVGQGVPARSELRPEKAGMIGLGAALLVFLLVTGLLDGGLYHLQYLFFAAIAFALLAASTREGASAWNRVAVPRSGIAVLLLAAMLLHGVMRDYRVEWTARPQVRQQVASPPGPP
ncbi:MAG: O-antigen ligase family protein [Rugosibacter sp.]|nr:O-antigen ligase family protein [Rugosibacter sp.]